MEKEIKQLWDISYIWGYNLKLVKLTVPADSEETAVEAAFDIAGRAFENRLVTAVKQVGGIHLTTKKGCKKYGSSRF